MSKLSYPSLCCLLGKSPSRLSQAMHNAGYAALELPFHFVACNTTDTEFGIKAMRELGIRGYALTIPHKESAIELVDAVSDEAEKIGAINTVVNDGETLSGYNTDVYGIVDAIREAGTETNGKRALLFGAGGAARAAVVALEQLGFSEVLICNRNQERAESLAQSIGGEVLPYTELESFDFASIDLFINSTPIGSKAAPEEAVYPFTFDVFSSKHTVFDMVTLETDLIKGARSSGAKTILGIRMLLFQALKQFELFTGESDAPVEAPIKAMEAALLEEISR